MVIAGGGTGGHVFPGLALADELRRRMPDRGIRWIGARRGLEAEVVPRSGLPMTLLPVQGALGRSTGAKALALASAGVAFARCAAGFVMRRPALAVGVGGYASGPAVLAAACLRVPTLLLEQNAVPGATNRLLSRVARAAAVPFAETGDALRCRAVVTGNPVRPEMSRVPPRRPGPARSMLVLGGSRGAHSINMAMIDAAPRLASSGLYVVHQSGRDDVDAVARAFREAGVRGEVHAFIDDMGRAYGEADLVVCRAGATTVAELAVVGRPALFIPFPHAVGDHQRINARRVADAGAARVLDPDDLDAHTLADAVLDLVSDTEALDRMAETARGLGRPDAAARIADLVEELLGDAA
jgi:UDP-N-acetylglucosamine--N-acetylmuramyl-(pentapeptide) pyrophosphoryl-undecaprenol N-acetylglucosamine transferase